jgi:hypothetical protein
MFTFVYISKFSYKSICYTTYFDPGDSSVKNARQAQNQCHISIHVSNLQEIYYKFY